MAHELAQLTGVSAVTLRRDLEALSSAGVLERTRGGARRLEVRHELDEVFATRERAHQQEKARIGAATLPLLQPHEALGMNDGSTVMQVARQLVRADLSVSVATNALNIALELVTDAPPAPAPRG